MECKKADIPVRAWLIKLSSMPRSYNLENLDTVLKVLSSRVLKIHICMYVNSVTQGGFAYVPFFEYAQEERRLYNM